MRKSTILLALTILISVSSRGQITLENTYNSYIYPVLLEVGGSKYAIHDKNNWELRLYNLDHSIYKIITIISPSTNLYDQAAYPNLESFDLLYVTEGLFDTDGEIEFLLHYSAYDSSWTNFIVATAIIKEDGSVLFKRDDASPRAEESEVIRAIMMASDGTTKLLLLGENIPPSTNNTLVYSLPGTLTCDPCGGFNGTGKTSGGSAPFGMKSYPNPAKHHTTIEYELPDDVNEGSLTIYSSTGIALKNYKIDKTFDNLRISTQDLPAGTYFYSICTPEGSRQSKKMIVVK